MVLIAAAVTTRVGKTIVSRQFVEMTKARIEGLLAAFPKLMSTGKQHTFVETDSVRYVYQPLEKLYMLLITTKASNILEDLETLRLFSRVIPEYCHTMEESEVIDNAFSLIFAFDEIVALGYRESVNLAQIRTFVEMDSHEEKVYQAVRQTQEREAKIKMREKAKELQRARVEAAKKGTPRSNYTSSSSSGGFGNNTIISNNVNDSSDKNNYLTIQKVSTTGPTATSGGTRGGMKLGSKTRDVDSFVAQLKSEGENITSTNLLNKSSTQPSLNQQQNNKTLISTGGSRSGTIHSDNMQDVHLRQEERMIIKLTRDGGIIGIELLGLLTLRIQNERYARVRIKIDNNNTDTKGIQLQTHPNVDKELFKLKSQIGLKNQQKPFPLNTDVGVLKYRLTNTTQNTDSDNYQSLLPLVINCWPTESQDTNSCDVNIEYELEHLQLELSDVTIVIPLPNGVTPIINECDGEYIHDGRKNQLIWNIPIIDSSNKSGALEFNCQHSQPNDFYPIQIQFTSPTTLYTDIKVSEVLLVDDETPVKHSVDTVFFTDKYEIV
ncbi:coatomer subunit delta [Chrysoperla carnea]|uniref:coatomer subunit delta n=1 Tax=Chrysoperla carnea TaxID=189513 RepID=UPI001D0657F2|nr:coatomer subunit delta [Chrysoperla carnea]